MSMSITSATFMHGHEIPVRHTCDGQDASPPLAWVGVPSGAKSLVLIVDDPDAPDPAAPKMTWVHWLLYNLPPGTQNLAEGMTSASLPAGALQGFNDWQRIGYGGPCPPTGRHRYFFKLYALDIVLPDLHKPDREILQKAMKAHVLDECSMFGYYQRQARI